MVEVLGAAELLAGAYELLRDLKGGKAEREQFKKARRVYRRVEAFLSHPLSHLVLHEQSRARLEGARDVLRRALGYSENLGRCLGQMAIDEEIEVRLMPDGFYVFRLKPDCNVDEFERGLYDPSPRLNP